MNSSNELEEFTDFEEIVYGFQGRRLDFETDGLMYFRNRYYNPRFGRWLQRDPLGYVNSYGLYEAFGGNPYMHSDPKGELWQMAVGAFIGAGIDYGFQVLGNVYSGKGWSSFADVNFSQIAMAAGAGALSGGISAFTSSALRSGSISGIGAAAIDFSADLAITVGQTLLEKGTCYTLSDFGSNLLSNMITSLGIHGISKLRSKNVNSKNLNHIVDKHISKTIIPAQFKYYKGAVLEELKDARGQIQVNTLKGKINIVEHFLFKKSELENMTRLKQTLFHEFGHAADPNLYRRANYPLNKIIDRAAENFADIWAIKNLLRQGSLDVGSLAMDYIERNGYLFHTYLGTIVVGGGSAISGLVIPNTLCD